MDYSKLSDFEINKLVAEKWLKLIAEDSKSKGRLDSDVWLNDDCGRLKYTNYNPCNNPSDAWPIILENKISINAYENDSGWFATTDTSFFVDDKNPLRAVMIVYLMMQDELKGE